VAAGESPGGVDAASTSGGVTTAAKDVWEYEVPNLRLRREEVRVWRLWGATGFGLG